MGDARDAACTFYNGTAANLPNVIPPLLEE